MFLTKMYFVTHSSSNVITANFLCSIGYSKKRFIPVLKAKKYKHDILIPVCSATQKQSERSTVDKKNIVITIVIVMIVIMTSFAIQ